MRAASIWIIFWLLVLAVLLGVLVLGVAIWREWFVFRPEGPHPSAAEHLPEWPPPEAPESLSVPIMYQFRRQWTADVGRPVGVAVAPKDRIYVVGEKRVQVFDSAGQTLTQWELPEPARCIVAAGPEHHRPGSIYLGYSGRVEIRTENGEIMGSWPLPGQRAEPTSIALAQKEIFVADFAAKCVHRFDAEGKLLSQIGKPDPARGYPGLQMPSAYCDVAVDKEGLLWVANPGLLRLEAYRPADGRLERFWGGQDLEGPAAFFGCCNPAHFCLLPDGRFVTAEKGLLRIKVYRSDGTLDGWVVSPQEWRVLVVSDPSSAGTAKPNHWTDRVEAADLAADSQGRIVVLYLANSRVYLFEPIPPPPHLPSGEP